MPEVMEKRLSSTYKPPKVPTAATLHSMALVKLAPPEESAESHKSSADGVPHLHLKYLSDISKTVI